MAQIKHMFKPSAVQLKPYNTFGIEAEAKHFAQVSDFNALISALDYADKNTLNLRVLGGGSNVLFTKNVDDCIIYNQFKGIEIVDENNEDVFLKIGAGENWHESVLFCIQNNYGGLENLSLIPGLVGASPIQNIGAYGVEVKDRIYEVHTVDLHSGKKVSFKNEECQFAYRDSFFKSIKPKQYFITAVVFKLTKSKHKILSHYGSIQSELDEKSIKKATIKDISNAVIAIRKSKLPDPKELGNSGSFFKNPVLKSVDADKILDTFKDAPNYPSANGMVKLAAGWLIEQSGWKGKRVGECGVHSKQALVLVNYGKAKGEDIFNLSEEVIQSVFEKFGVKLEREVNIW